MLDLLFVFLSSLSLSLVLSLLLLEVLFTLTLLSPRFFRLFTLAFTSHEIKDGIGSTGIEGVKREKERYGGVVYRGTRA